MVDRDNRGERFFVALSSKPEQTGVYEIVKYRGSDAGLARRDNPLREAMTVQARRVVDVFVPVTALITGQEINHRRFGTARFTPIKISRD